MWSDPSGSARWWSDRVVQQTLATQHDRPQHRDWIPLDYAQGSTFFLAMEARWTHHLDDVADPFLTRLGTSWRLDSWLR